MYNALYEIHAHPFNATASKNSVAVGFFSEGHAVSGDYFSGA